MYGLFVSVEIGASLFDFGIRTHRKLIMKIITKEI